MNIIKQLRQKLDLSRKSFAQKLGITYGAIANYELGTRKPDIYVCYRIIDLAKQHKIKVNLEDIYPRSSV